MGSCELSFTPHSLHSHSAHGHGQQQTTKHCTEKPLKGGYVRQTDAEGHRYNTGDTITYHCNRGHRLIGQANRTCNGTAHEWEPEQPYCEPEYVGHLMRRLSGIEAAMRVIKQSIAAFENNTLQIGYNISVMDNRMSTIDNKVTAIDNSISAMKCDVSSFENSVSATYNMSMTELFKWQIARNRERLAACTNTTNLAIDEDTVTKCLTMQMGERNGSSASVYTWVIDDYNNRMAKQDDPHSQPFYHTVPGHKFRLRGSIHRDSDIFIYPELIPGEYDDQVQWPFSRKYDVTVLTNVGLEVLRISFSGQKSNCELDRPSSVTTFRCYTYYSGWTNVLPYKKHILKDGSVVVKLYFYN